MEDILIRHGNRSIRFDHMPVLAEHISIPPHEEVSDANHSYSFTENGGDLCFHSPEALPEGSLSLASFLAAVAAGFPNTDSKIRPERANEELRILTTADSGSDLLPGIPSLLSGDNPIVNWMSFGDVLSRTYGIEQFALINWSD